MDFFTAALLALVQGLTEFLPISSSAHLILAPRVFGFTDQGLAFDVAVHLGSLGAVMLYFRRRLWRITVESARAWTARAPATEASRLGAAIVVGTLPVIVAGLAMKGLVETELRSPVVIALATIGFGLVLYAADRWSSHRRPLAELGLREALIIGLFQALALIPGTSRSGITITAGLLLGFKRKDASEFSFLLAVPTILMSAALMLLELIEQTAPVDWRALGLGALLSFAAAYVCIRLFLGFIERIGMTPFVIYRLVLGLLLLWLFV